MVSARVFALYCYAVRMAEQVITKVRFTTELCGYFDLGHIDVKALQEEFADRLKNFFVGRVRVGDKFPKIGVNVQDSRDEVLGTAIVGDILVYLGIEPGEDLERVCDQFVTHEKELFKTQGKNPPITWWEVITEDTEKARAEEKAARKEYSKGLLAGSSARAEEIKKRARERTASGAPLPSSGPAAGSPESYAASIAEDDHDPEDDL